MSIGRLYGLGNSNRQGDDLWGKNQFNSNFPTSLACYMKDNGIEANYLTISDELDVVSGYLPVSEVFNTALDEPFFCFESKYEPYQEHCYDDIKGIDLVVKDENDFRRALEVKLTVVPDQTTFSKPEDHWAPELVIRPATTSYCALGIYDSVKEKKEDISSLFEPLGSKIKDWGNSHEICSHGEDIVKVLNEFQLKYIEYQKPFLMQPIWRTKGKSPILSSDAFDLFVWSDFAICRAFIGRSLESYNSGSVNRYARSTTRLFRVLFELSTKKKVRLNDIYTEMQFGLQTDKEFSLAGNITKDLIKSDNRVKPRLPPSVLKYLILDGGEKNLSPERRLDLSLYFAAQHVFENDD